MCIALRKKYQAKSNRKKATPKPKEPLQLRLRFPTQFDCDLPVIQRKIKYLGGPYVLFRDGMWHAYRSRYKSQYYRGRCIAFCISAKTIPELTKAINKTRDYSLGFRVKPKVFVNRPMKFKVANAILNTGGMNW